MISLRIETKIELKYNVIQCMCDDIIAEEKCYI